MIMVSIDGKEFPLSDNRGMQEAMRKRANEIVDSIDNTDNVLVREAYAELLALTMFYAVKTGGVIANYESMGVLAIPTEVIKRGVQQLTGVVDRQTNTEVELAPVVTEVQP